MTRADRYDACLEHVMYGVVHAVRAALEEAGDILNGHMPNRRIQENLLLRALDVQFRRDRPVILIFYSIPAHVPLD